MKARLFAAPLFILALALAAPSGAHAGAVAVGTDDPGDWGLEFDPTVAPLGDALGMDLVSAAIDAPGNGTATFIIGVTQLPATGGLPEGARYLWEMKVNGKHYELDGKFTNYSRGACDPTAGTCPPPRDPGVAPFVVRGDCVSNGAVVTCTEIGLVHATFDVAAATISIPVPITMLRVTSGCATILPDVNDASFPGGSIVTIPSAFFSQNTMPNDKMELDYDLAVEAC